RAARRGDGPAGAGRTRAGAVPRPRPRPPPSASRGTPRHAGRWPASGGRPGRLADGLASVLVGGRQPRPVGADLRPGTGQAGHDPSAGPASARPRWAHATVGGDRLAGAAPRAAQRSGRDPAGSVAVLTLARPAPLARPPPRRAAGSRLAGSLRLAL